MNKPALDIIVPVWNRPIETRNCLVNLLNYSPDARFIMVDNGSDRETERLLQEFAEGLDDRAFLLRNDINQGEVKALNRGLAKGEAEYLAVVRSSSLVSAGWVEPLLEFLRQRPDAGVVLPRLVNAANKKGEPHGHQPFAREVCCGSFAAMLIRKKLYDAVGGFDEQMDGGIWCLNDYSRRACRADFLTFSVAGGTVSFVDEVPLGSVARREEMMRRTISLFRGRWGEDTAYCMVMPKGTDLSMVGRKLELLLDGARRGVFFSVVVSSSLYKEMVRAGSVALHENIRIEPLPLICTDSRIRKILARIVSERPDTVMVVGIDGMGAPGVDNPLAFTELEERIRRLQ